VSLGFYTSTQIQFLYHITADDSWVLGSLGPQVPDTWVPGSPVSSLQGPGSPGPSVYSYPD